MELKKAESQTVVTGQQSQQSETASPQQLEAAASQPEPEAAPAQLHRSRTWRISLITSAVFGAIVLSPLVAALTLGKTLSDFLLSSV